MKVITIEEHINSEEILDEMIESRDDFTEEQKKGYKERTIVGGRLTDVEEYRLKYMEEAGIDMQILSYVNPETGRLQGQERTNVSIRANDFLKEQVDKHPDKFAAFASLPLWDVEASCKELERCVKDYGFVGGFVQGKVDGHYLDEKQFFPIFEKAAELDVPIHFHPTMPDEEIRNHYYTSHDGSWSPQISFEFGSVALGWHLDIGIQVVRMILSGVFDKLPNLKLITGHWGEGMVMMLDRMDYMLPKSSTGLKKNISEYYKENIYVTPSGIESEINLEAVTKYMGADHIIWAADYPFLKEETVADFLINSDLNEEEKELIAHENAEKLFRLKK